jgi:hypothetical protein
MLLCKNCGWCKNFDCIFEFRVKSYVRNTIKLSCTKIFLTSVIYYLLYNATSFDPTLGSSSGQEQKIGDMKCTCNFLLCSTVFPISIFTYTTGWPQLRLDTVYTMCSLLLTQCYSETNWQYLNLPSAFLYQTVNHPQNHFVLNTSW